MFRLVGAAVQAAAGSCAGAGPFGLTTRIPDAPCRVSGAIAGRCPTWWWPGSTGWHRSCGTRAAPGQPQAGQLTAHDVLRTATSTCRRRCGVHAAARSFADRRPVSGGKTSLTVLCDQLDRSVPRWTTCSTRSAGRCRRADRARAVPGRESSVPAAGPRPAAAMSVLEDVQSAVDALVSVGWCRRGRVRRSRRAAALSAVAAQRAPGAAGTGRRCSAARTSGFDRCSPGRGALHDPGDAGARRLVARGDASAPAYAARWPSWRPRRVRWAAEPVVVGIRLGDRRRGKPPPYRRRPVGREWPHTPTDGQKRMAPADRRRPPLPNPERRRANDARRVARRAGRPGRPGRRQEPRFATRPR